MIWDRLLFENERYPLRSFLREGLNPRQANLHPKIHQKTKKGQILEEAFMYREHTAWTFTTWPAFLTQCLGSRRWKTALPVPSGHISERVLICSKVLQLPRPPISPLWNGQNSHPRATKWHPLHGLWLLAHRRHNKAGYSLSALCAMIIKTTQEQWNERAAFFSSEGSSWHLHVAPGSAHVLPGCLSITLIMLCRQEGTCWGRQTLVWRWIYRIWENNYRPHIFLSLLCQAISPIPRTMAFLLPKGDTLKRWHRGLFSWTPWDESQMSSAPKWGGPVTELSFLHSAGAQLLPLMSSALEIHPLSLRTLLLNN